MSRFVIPALLILLCTCDAFVAFSSSPTGRLASRQTHLQPSHNIATNFLLRATEGNVEDAEVEIDLATIPTYLPSERGIDYVPFATMLAVGDFKGADQFTRDNLIKISGPGSVKRQFVYWTEVKNLPATDLATMERLWLQFSGGNFGYSVQKRVWDVENANFDNYIRRIGWTTIDNGNERKLKWFGQSEFIYDVEKAPKGHLPLTSALRGTQLMKELMNHPVWVQYDWRNYKDLKWGP
jgi:GUN4-like